MMLRVQTAAAAAGRRTRAQWRAMVYTADAAAGNPSPLPDLLPAFSRAEFDDTCKRRFIYGPAFDSYGGAAGLHDLGPVGTAIKHNALAVWRRHFVIEDDMLELDATALTPADVLDTSGHTQRFTDVLVQDSVTGVHYRLDKYLEEWVAGRLTAGTPAAKAPRYSDDDIAALRAHVGGFEGMSLEALAAFLIRWDVRSPAGHAFTDPRDFTLMFGTALGPEGGRGAFLRPELAQGILLNFNRLLEFNNGRMPFAGACVGAAFRNEIAPRNHLLRVREFTLAEIEHFVNPRDKSCAKFAGVADGFLWMLTAEDQAAGRPASLQRLGAAVATGVVANETLGYYIGRAALYLKALGIHHARLRQHRPDEMAHYAADCWDIEVLTSYGWVECVGIADRACYDLAAHAAATKTTFTAYERYAEPRMETVLAREINKGLVNKTFKRDGQAVIAYLNGLSDAAAVALEARLADGDVAIEVDASLHVHLTRAMVAFRYVEKKVDGYHYTPSVVEPSFGVGRLIYALLEQTYYVRREESAAAAASAAAEVAVDAVAGGVPEGGKQKKKKKNKSGTAVAPTAADANEKRAVFALPAVLAPYKVAIMPLSPSVYREAYCQDVIRILRTDLHRAGIEHRVDVSAQSIGKKYARADEIGVPYAVTVDTTYPETRLLTLRERDSTAQVFMRADDVVAAVRDLASEAIRWTDLVQQYEVKTA